MRDGRGLPSLLLAGSMNCTSEYRGSFNIPPTASMRDRGTVFVGDVDTGDGMVGEEVMLHIIRKASTCRTIFEL